MKSFDGYGAALAKVLTLNSVKHHEPFLPPSERSLAISKRVFVGNLNFRTTEQQLAAALAGAGEVSHVHMGTDRETGRSRGFAFVEFASEEAAAEAIKKFDGFEVDGRKLRVNTAEDRPRGAGPRPGGPRPDRPRFSPGPSMATADPFSGGFNDHGFGGAGKPFKNKGSRRGLRARKRSLSF